MSLISNQKLYFRIFDRTIWLKIILKKIKFLDFVGFILWDLDKDGLLQKLEVK